MDRDKTLIVIAAGNDHGHPCTPGSASCEGGILNAASPAVDAAFQVFFDELRSHVVAVVATDRDGNIATFSEPLWHCRKWCIAAPGVDILVARFSPGMLLGGLGDRSYLKVRGTSFSAPYVAGGLALLMQRFPTLGNDEILIRLYETADQSGAAAPDDPADTGGRCPDDLDTNNNPDNCELSSIFGWGRMDLDAATLPLE